MAERTRIEMVYVDDLTDEEIPNGGWELCGLRNGRTYHFQSLTNVAEALLAHPEVFGLSVPQPDSPHDYDRLGIIAHGLTKRGVL